MAEITKMIIHLDEPEDCAECGKEMERLIVCAPQINTSNCQFQVHHNPAFGKVIHSKRQIQDEILRIKDTTGKEIVEVGNDSLQSVKKNFKKYDDNIKLGDF